MTAQQAQDLATAIAAKFPTVQAYCRARNIRYSTLSSAARRAGVALGREVRWRRVASVLQAAERNPKRSVSWHALEAGFSSAQAFYRARRSLMDRVFGIA